MNSYDNPEENRFRTEIRSWLSQELPEFERGQNLTFEERLAADKVLARGRYLAYSWPEKYGGQNGSPTSAAILDEECSLAGIPRSLSPSRFGISLIGQTLIALGSEYQKERFLGPILRAEELWCQGFSEPDAGSDLANVQSFAEEVDNGLILNGTKIWTTQAHKADWCFALVKTSKEAPRYKNLSMVLFPMNQKSITVTPIRQLNGDSDFNQLYFDGVRIKKENIIGPINSGWSVAMKTLSFERSYGQLSRFREYELQLHNISKMIAQADADENQMSWQETLGMLLADLEGIRNISYKILATVEANKDLGSLPSIAKLWWSTTHQHIVDLGHELASHGYGSLDYWQHIWLRSRAETIYAGSSEIQRNIISEKFLGLPRG